jgi:hypothetical protein
MVVRKAYLLTQKAVKPNNMEKQKVKLAYNVVSWPVRNALIYYSESSPDLFPLINVRPTVEFMDSCRQFFDILNINHVKKGPISSVESKKLQNLASLSDYFENIFVSGILTRETHSALQQTISASIEIVKLLLSRGSGRKVFTARFQQDPLEEHFGQHR